jgi:DNA-directed RNA polymerase subunit K/omega
MNSDDEENDINLETEDVIDMDQQEQSELPDVDEQDIDHQEMNDDYDDSCLDIIEPDIQITNIIVDPSKRTSKNKMTRYEFVRIIGERIMQLTKGAKPLIKNAKESNEFTYKEIAIEELKANMIPFKIRRFVKDHYEIWKIEELNKKHLEPLF